MPAIIADTLGKITISDDILAILAGYLTIENYGVVGMASQSASDGLVELLRRENLKKGVKVFSDGQTVKIDLYIIVEYGVSISAVAENIINNVTYRLKEITGLNVVSVDIHVEGVRVQQT